MSNASAKRLKNVCDAAFLQEEKEKEVREEQAEDRRTDTIQSWLVPQEYERALKEAYKSFVIPGSPKVDINGYVDQANPHIKVIIEYQQNKMQSTEINMMLRVKWKKLVKSAFMLDPENREGAQDIEGNNGNNSIKVRMSNGVS